mmetsp:Transcript_66447/g.183578  ORF Transcript_66447/g.183578 Transcript_66447/m.183578 type:complete len:215 (+) Transcript_66447:649-1293(+)
MGRTRKLELFELSQLLLRLSGQKPDLRKVRHRPRLECIALRPKRFHLSLVLAIQALLFDTTTHACCQVEWLGLGQPPRTSHIGVRLGLSVLLLRQILAVHSTWAVGRLERGRLSDGQLLLLARYSNRWPRHTPRHWAGLELLCLFLLRGSDWLRGRAAEVKWSRGSGGACLNLGNTIQTGRVHHLGVKRPRLELVLGRLLELLLFLLLEALHVR